MKNDHVTEALLDALEDQEVSQGHFTRHVLRHLQSTCTECRREIAIWRTGRNPRRHAQPLLQMTLQERVPDAQEIRRAQEDFQSLLPLTPARRERKIRRARSRFCSPVLARLLVEDAIREWISDFEEASSLLDAAFQVLDRGPYSRLGDEVRILTRAARAFSFKLQGDLNRAEGLFLELRALIRRDRLIDPSLAAQVNELEGSFWRDRRVFGRSKELLLRAIYRYRLLQDDTRLARALLVIGNTYFYSGDVSQAIATAKEAFELSRGNLTFQANAAHNVTLYLTESGRLDEAIPQFQANLPRYRKARGSWRFADLYFHWLAGKIRRGLGQLDDAEKHLERARDGFSHRGTAYDALLVCLDLALVYQKQERYKDLEDLSQLMVRGLDAVSLHDEATAALVLLTQAVRQRTVDEDFVRRIAHFLQFSLINPDLRCDIQLPDPP